MTPWLSDIVCMLIGHSYNRVVAIDFGLLEPGDSISECLVCRRCQHQEWFNHTEMKFTFKEDNNMDGPFVKVELQTERGDYVTTGVVPRFLTPPAVLVWGERIFRQHSLNVYRECFTVEVVRTVPREAA